MFNTFIVALNKYQFIFYLSIEIPAHLASLSDVNLPYAVPYSLKSFDRIANRHRNEGSERANKIILICPCVYISCLKLGRVGDDGVALYLCVVLFNNIEREF